MRHTTDIKMKTAPQQLHLINRLKRETSTTAADEKIKGVSQKKTTTQNLGCRPQHYVPKEGKLNHNQQQIQRIKAASQQKIYSKE